MTRAILSLITAAALLASATGAAAAASASPQECDSLYQQMKQKNQHAASAAFAKFIRLGCVLPTQS